MKRKALLFLIILAFGLPWMASAQKTLPYEYGFENHDLTTEGWTMLSSSFSTGIAASGHSGEYGFMFYKSPDPQYLISPELSTATNGLAVEFYYKSSAASYPKPFRVGYSTTGNGVSDFTFGDEITTTNGQWTFFSQTFDRNTKYIAIKYEYNASYTGLYIDDFNFEEYSAYPKPKNLLVTTYTSSTATLDWGARVGQNHWDIYYTTSLTVPDAGTTPSVVNTTTKPYTITELESGVTYHAYVRGNYNNGEHFSDWSDACTFEVGCYTPTIGQSMATCNQAYFAWTPVGTETSWQVAFSDQQGFDPDDVTPETVTTQYYIKEDLATGVTYYARVRAVCGAGDYSDWSDEVSMTTECIAPSNLRATSVSPSTATLIWQRGSNESQWQISYSTTANFAPENGTILTVNANPYTLEELTLNTQYYAYVRAVCAETIFSDWSSICTFMPKYELTVGNGANYNSFIPICTSAIDYTTKSQFIVPASDLTNLLYANISKMTFYANSETGNMGAATFDVLISELNDVTAFENYEFFDWSEMTSVYSGSLSVSGSKMEIILNAPYQYMGGDLLIGFTETASGTGNSFGWYGAETTGYSAYGGYEMTAYSYTSYSRYKFMPKTTFSYTPGTAPTCMKPSNLSISQTSISATLTWTVGEDETHWNVQYKEASSSEWSNIIAVENTPTYTLNNLSPITNYQVRVQADCGGGDTSGWITGAFTTSCGPTSVPYTHDFDNDATGSSAVFPQCWTKINDAEDPNYANYPYVSGSNAHSGSNCLFFMRLYDYTALNQIAVLPEMNADVRTLQLSFYARLGSSTNQPLSVGVMTDPEDASTFVKIEDVAIASNEYAEYTVSFASYAGSGHFIALKCERADVYNQIYVDDINVTTNNICFAPENPQISDVTANSAVITWTPDGSTTNWQVQYKKTTDADWSEPIAVNGTPSYTFSNLDATTTYQARVRTDCGNDNYSDWVDAENFTTDCGFVTLPYSHNFDDDATGHVAPTCWHFSDGTYPYIYESSSAHSGNHYLQIKKNTDYAATLVLPAIDTDENPINTLKLTFWARSSQSTYYYEYLYAGVMTDPDDMSTFHSVQGATTNLSTTTYKQFEFYFDNWTGEGNYIALRYGGSTTYYIDDIEVSVAPTCRQPLDLSTQYTNAHEAEIRWKTRDLRQCNYQVSYSTDATFNPEDGTIVDVEFENTLVNAGTPYRDYYLTCLNANTTYYYYVRANCGNGDFSEWSDDYASLTTGEPCPAPYGFYANTVKNTYAELRWYGDIESEWQFQYKKTTDEEWITPTEMEFLNGEGNEIIFRLSGLESGMDYDCRVREHCGMYSCPVVDDGYSEWAIESFTTGTGCAEPQPWMCLTQMGTSATLEWYQTGEERQWQIRYRLDEEWTYPEENIVLTDEMDEARKQRWTITGLQTNSMYYWQVRAYCDSENQSDWSEESYFFTGGDKITVDKNHSFFEDFEGTSGMPDGWMRCNQYNYDLDYYMPWSYTPAEGPSWDERPGNHGIYNNHSDFNGSTSVILPEMHLDETAHSTMFSFWSYCDYGPSAISGQNISYGSMQIMASTNHGETYDYLWWSFGPHRYWRQHFVDLDDYIGQDVIIRIDYWYANNNPNFDWYIDDVKVQVFDNSFGSGSDVTSGDWNDPDMWGNGTPNGDDDVIINANVNIPEGVVAEANQIVINTDTINTGSKAQKFGKLTIADGGQLKVNNSVTATMQKDITASETKTSNAWYAISSPVNNIAIADFVQGIHNVYQYDEPSMMWQEYRNDDNIFENLTNGRGYLYRSTATGLEFTGDINVGEVSCQLSYACADNRFKGFNLIGNPYPHNIYKGENAAIPNTWLEDGFYTLTESGAWSAGTDNATPIKPNTGILVQAKSDANMKNLVFTDTDGHNTAKSGDDNIMFTVRNSVYSDVAYVLFKEGRGLNKIEHRNADIQMLYVINDGEDFAIADMNDNTKLINLGFEAKTMGQYTISVKAEGEFSYMHLVDKLTGDDTDMLMENSYTFVGTPGDRLDRFVLRLEYDGGPSTSSDIFAYQSGCDIIVSGEGELQVFDIMGRMVMTQHVNGVQTCHVASLQTGVYILKLNGMTQKIVVR
jgi:hypothetical protein